MNEDSHFYFVLQEAGAWFLSSGLQIVVILILMTIALKFAQLISGRIFSVFTRHPGTEEMKKRADTLGAIVRNTLNVVVFLVASTMILREFGIDVAPILATAGVVGLAVGFGAQKLVEDIISGFFLLLEDQIRVGDAVQIGAQAGIVERITLRLVILRDIAGNVYYIRNGQINTVMNMTKDYSRYVFDIGVAYGENIDEVVKVIQMVDEDIRKDPSLRQDILEPIEILGLDQFADSALILKARTKTKPLKQWSVAREFNKRLKKAFDVRATKILFFRSKQAAI
jgi:small conductance mechanosensitive channel